MTSSDDVVSVASAAGAAVRSVFRLSVHGQHLARMNGRIVIAAPWRTEYKLSDYFGDKHPTPLLLSLNDIAGWLPHKYHNRFKRAFTYFESRLPDGAIRRSYTSEPV